jgi:hypothetical protein
VTLKPKYWCEQTSAAPQHASSALTFNIMSMICPYPAEWLHDIMNIWNPCQQSMAMFSARFWSMSCLPLPESVVWGRRFRYDLCVSLWIINTERVPRQFTVIRSRNRLCVTLYFCSTYFNLILQSPIVEKDDWHLVVLSGKKRIIKGCWNSPLLWQFSTDTTCNTRYIISLTWCPLTLIRK